MKIKKFSAYTEQEAIEKVKRELGLDALVINVKRIQPSGIFAIFRRPVVEITAAYEEAKTTATITTTATTATIPVAAPVTTITAAAVDNAELQKFESSKRDVKIAAQDEKIRMLQDMLVTTSDMLARAQDQLSVSRHKRTTDRKYQNNLVQIFYDTLLENGVLAEIAEDILDDLDNVEDVEKLDINFIVKIVYNSIIEIIGATNQLEVFRPKPRKIAFIGPTGVGKTTTIAKLTAEFILKSNLSVGLVTADTYRIAAVEQLRTYGDIFGIDVYVVYKEGDLADHLEALSHSDAILIDTAGRSHKNRDNLVELKELLDSVADVEKFLVLSLTTKFEDMLDITTTFSEFCDFTIIFTKLDETLQMGAVLNICYKTGRKLSYITFGQNVPDDIKKVEPHEVAMQLLGLGDEI
ncbi:MAG: flagellar biosynthesis protein FlhF [Defluviitaleaceae bacterium]|nr:flagellar biosynthesis protein FlhF [Defluviitaleaceae bacterium]